MSQRLTRPLNVNDEVWSKRFGYGKVTNVNQGDTYPYVVQFNDSEQCEIFSAHGAYQISKPDINIDLAGPVQIDRTIEPNKSIKIVQTIAVKNKENGHQEGTIIDIDGCKIFRSGDSMIILPQNDDL